MCADRAVRVWDMAQTRLLQVSPSAPTRAGYCRHTVRKRSAKLRWWQTFDDHRHPVTALSFSPNDAHVASGNNGGEVLVHGLVTQRLTATLAAQSDRAGLPTAINQLEYSRLRKSLLGTATAGGSVFVWDVNAPEQPQAVFVAQHSAACTGVAFSPVNHGDPSSPPALTPLCTHAPYHLDTWLPKSYNVGVWTHCGSD